jgi:hypothetical protein
MTPTGGFMLYKVGVRGAKQHFCSNYYIAQQVRDDLVSRFDKMGIIEGVEDQTKIIWNPGGSSYGDVIFEFDLAGITLGCYACHWFAFKDKIKSLDSTKYDGKFFKIHGINIFCLSNAQKNQLDYQFKTRKDELDKLARQEQSRLSNYVGG